MFARLRGRRDLPLARFLRFLVVGGVNTAVGYAIYALALFATGRYVLASAISLVMGIAFSFKTHRRFVFDAAGPQAGPFARYVAAWAVIYLLNLGGLALLVHAGVDAYLAGAIMILPVAALSFAIMRWLVFPAPAPAR